jgi:hypothetical protein
MNAADELPEGWRDMLATCDFRLAAEELREMLYQGIEQDRREQGPGDAYFEPTFYAVLKDFWMLRLLRLQPHS